MGAIVLLWQSETFVVLIVVSHLLRIVQRPTLHELKVFHAGAVCPLLEVHETTAQGIVLAASEASAGGLVISYRL